MNLRAPGCRASACALLLGACAAAAAHESPPQADAAQPNVLLIPANDAALRQQLGSRFGHLQAEPNALRVEADAQDRAWLDAQGISWRIDEQASALLHASLQPLSDQRAIPGHACYRTVEETFATMDQLAASYPALATVIDIGDSWKKVQNPALGYDLRVLKLGNSAIGGVKPKMFAMTAIHAREYTTAELLTRYAEELLNGYGTDADATWLLDHHEFHFLLHANPDGRKKAESGSSWRKNINDTLCQGSGAGIDLNRNYPVWWSYPNGGSSTNACSETYRGTAAASEPETQAVRDYLESIFPDRRPGNPETVATAADANTQGLFLDIHSYSKLVLWPWGHVTAPTGNAEQLATLGMRLAWFNNYEPQQAVGLYPTRGTTDDFAYGDLGLPSYTIELGVAFFESCDSFENATLPINLQALRYAARTLHAPYVLPAGPDAIDVSIPQATIVAGQPATLAARIDDSRYRNQQQPTDAPSAARPRHNIAGARYFIGKLPWEAGAVGADMQASDGSFDATAESVTAQIDTTNLSAGRHVVYVQGRDAANEVGPPAAAFLCVLDPVVIFGGGFEESSAACEAGR
ncbi:MAG: M14 family zinc carboxypeptidase [Lysobacteraceae bacterium]